MCFEWRDKLQEQIHKIWAHNVGLEAFQMRNERIPCWPRGRKTQESKLELVNNDKAIKQGPATSSP